MWLDTDRVSVFYSLLLLLPHIKERIISCAATLCTYDDRQAIHGKLLTGGRLCLGIRWRGHKLPLLLVLLGKPCVAWPEVHTGEEESLSPNDVASSLCAFLFSACPLAVTLMHLEADLGSLRSTLQ